MKKILLSIVLALTLILALATPALADDERYDYYKSGGGDGAYWGVRAGHCVAQSFKTTSSYNITSIKVKAYRAGSPGNINVGITEVDGDGWPRGSWLASGTFNANEMTENTDGAWYEIIITTEYYLSDDTEYAVIMEVFSGDGSNCVWWLEDKTDPEYKDGRSMYMTDNVWDAPEENGDMMFQIYGAEWYTYSESDVDKLIKRLKSQIDELNAQIDDLSSQASSLSSQVSEFVNIKVRLERDLGTMIESKLGALNNEIALTRDEVANVRSELVTMEDGIANTRGEIALVRDEIKDMSGMDGRLTPILAISILTLVAVVILVIRRRAE